MESNYNAGAFEQTENGKWIECSSQRLPGELELIFVWIATLLLIGLFCVSAIIA